LEQVRHRCLNLLENGVGQDVLGQEFFRADHSFQTISQTVTPTSLPSTILRESTAHAKEPQESPSLQLEGKMA
jgi:hypothetical protein